jgi:alginate O-acetyltransferase complex protein AlgI
MLLGGLWHGAAWTFVVWGGLHGLYLSVERVLRQRFAGYTPGPVAFFALGLLTYALVNVTWVFFRAHSFGKAWEILGGMFGAHGDAKPQLTTFNLVSAGAIVVCLVATHWFMRARTLESAIARTHPAVITLLWGLMAFAIVIAQGSGAAFIYFQF